MPPAAGRDRVTVTLADWQADFLRWHLLAYTAPGSLGRTIRDLIPDNGAPPMLTATAVDDFLQISAGGHAQQPIHPSAIIGHPPEVRDWKPGDPCLPPRIHKTARVNAYVTIDAGTVRPTTIGARSWLLKRAHVGHDALVGEDCELATGCIIGGHVQIGDRTHVGLAAVILPHRTIGADCVIGAGAIVTKDLPDGSVVAGNPARPITRNPVRHTERADEQRSL